jgi:hypothetical protein
MSYISSIEMGSFEDRLGCRSDCNCGPCKSGMNESPQSESLKGWNRSSIGLGYYGQLKPGTPEVGPQTSSPGEQTLFQHAVRRGIRNPRQLSNIIFFARHPSRRRSPIASNEGALIAEWRQIRERIVLPALQQMFGPPNGVVRDPRVELPRLHGSARFGFG